MLPSLTPQEKNTLRTDLNEIEKDFDCLMLQHRQAGTNAYEDEEYKSVVEIRTSFRESLGLQ